jgi:hypothetical protein
MSVGSITQHLDLGQTQGLMRFVDQNDVKFAEDISQRYQAIREDACPDD